MPKENPSSHINTSIQFHNCAFHAITPFVVAFLCDRAIHSNGFDFKECTPTAQQKAEFKQTSGYEHFLTAFSQIYKIDQTNQIEASLLKMLEKYPHPLDLQVLLGPVLRQTLKEILNSSSSHKEGLKSSFQTLLGTIHEKLGNDRISYQNRNVITLSAWLKSLTWSNDNEHEELFIPNIEIIAKLLCDDTVTQEQLWEEIYQNYVNYLCAPAKGVYVSQDHVKILCEAFRFEMILDKNSAAEDPGFISLAILNLLNASEDHWEIKKNNSSTQWDYTTQQNEAQFRAYHHSTSNLLSYGVSEQILAQTQQNFQEKIHQVLTQSIEYQDNALMQMPSIDWANNSGLEGLVNIIIGVAVDNKNYTCKTAENREINFKDTAEFNDLLQQFKTYYGLAPSLSANQIMIKMKEMLLSYPSATDRFIIISPVLRKLLKGEDVRSAISLVDLKQLCEGFNVALDVFAIMHNQINEFDKIDAGKKVENTFTKIAVAAAENRWILLEKDELKALQANAQFLNSPSLLKSAEECTLSQELSTIQRGMSAYLQTGVFYSRQQYTTVLPQQIVRQTRRNTTLPPLHAAIYAGNIAEVQRRLGNNENWRNKVSWEVCNQENLRTPTTRLNLNALALAASLNKREIVSLILSTANFPPEAAIAQEAYDIACNFKHVDVLYAFLPFASIKHSYHALLTAVEHKDLSLFVALVDLGAPLIQQKVNDAALLQWSIKVNDANHEQADFSSVFQNMLLSIAHQQRIQEPNFKAKDFVFNERALKVVDNALERRQIVWVKNLLHYVENMSRLLHKENELKEVVQENQKAISELIATHACQAIIQNNSTTLANIIGLDLKCLMVPGKHNPIHAALKIDRYPLIHSALIHHVEEQSPASEVSTQENNSKVTQYLAFVNQHAYDEHERTAAFRLERIAYKTGLHTSLANSSSWMSSIQTGLSLAKFWTAEAGIYCLDRIHKKTLHNQQIQQLAVSQVGQPALYAARAISAISPRGMLRYGMEIAYYCLPSVLARVVSGGANRVLTTFGASDRTAAIYAPVLAEGALGFLIMPQFYVASTLLSNGVYLAFKDSGYNNLEAIAQLVAGEVAYAWTTPKVNYEIDERHLYHLNKNLSPYFGEWASSQYLTPAVAGIESAYNQFHTLANYPLTVLSPYFSAHSLSQIREAVGINGISLEVPQVLQQAGEAVQTGVSYFRQLDQQKNAFVERLGNLIEGELLGVSGDSAFKRERLHALQVFEVHRLNNQISSLKEEVSRLEKNGSKDNTLQQALDNLISHQSLLQKAITQEEVLYKQTEGAKYYEAWQEKHIALKYAEVDTRVNAQALTNFQKEESEAKDKCYFYNCESTNKTVAQWARTIDDMFSKNKANFIDQTNLVGAIETIVKATFDCFTDRNQMAAHAAKEIIRYKYPLYPEVGDAAAIEAERQTLINTISTDKLSGFQRNPGRAKNRLYDYVLAEITNTKVPRHVHRHERILKPFINEILGQSIGWVPFKDFKGGRPSSGNVGMQVTHQLGQGTRTDLTVSNAPVVNVINTQKKKKTVTLNQDKELQKLSTVTVSSSATLTQPKIDRSQSALSFNSALAMDNPIIVNILAEQLENTFGSVIKPKAPVLNLFETTRQTRSQTRAMVQPKPKQNEGPKVSRPVKTLPLKGSTLTPQQRSNREIAPPWLLAFLEGVSDSAIPAREVTGLMFEVAKESVAELVNGAKTLAEFASSEFISLKTGQETQTQKAIALLAIFVGEEAARLVLREETKTSQFAKQLAMDFEGLDKRERVKALSKLALSFAPPLIEVTQTRAMKSVVAVAESDVVKVSKAPSKAKRADYVPQESTVLKQQKERLGSLLEKRAEFTEVGIASTAKPLTPKYNLRSQNTIVSNGVKLPIKATFVGEFNPQHNPNINITGDAAKTFMGCTYKSYILEEGINLYRLGNKADRRMKPYFSFEKNTSELKGRIDCAIRDVWPNNGRSILNIGYQVRVPKGTIIHVGVAAPQGEIFLGGRTQVYIENAQYIKGLEIIDTYAIEEELLWNLKAKK